MPDIVRYATQPRIEPRAVIFDGDGVIFDTREIHQKIRRLLNRLNFIFGSENEISPLRGQEMRTALEKSGLNRFQFFLYIRIWRLAEFFYRPKLINGANELIAALKREGRVVGLLTNRGSRACRLAILRGGLDWRRLDFIVTCDPSLSPRAVRKLSRRAFPNQYSGDFAKPDGRAVLPVRHLLRHLPGYPRSVYYVGDNLIDLNFARANGFRFIAVLSGNIQDPSVWLNAGADLIIGNITSLGQEGLRKYLF